MATTNYTKVNYFLSLDNLGNPSNSWADSGRYILNEIINSIVSPQNYIFTQTNASLSVPLNLYGNENFALLEVWHSGSSGNLSIYSGSKLIAKLNKTNLNSNQFNFIKVNLTGVSNVDLNFITTNLDSKSSFAIGNIFLANYNEYKNHTKLTNSLISAGILKVVQFTDINKTNLANTNHTIVNFTSTLGGYKLTIENVTRLVNVNYPYYNNVNSNAILVSSFGGVNQAVIIEKPVANVFLEFDSYRYWLIGVFVQLFSIFVAIIVIISLKAGRRV